MRQEREVVHGPYRVVVSEASRRQGLKRYVYLTEADTWLEARGGPQNALADVSASMKELGDNSTELRMDFWALTVERAACLAAATVFEIDGVAADVPDCDAFLELPDAFVNAWGQAARDLNPHWAMAQEEEAEDEEKKDSGLLSDSPSLL